ncbi:MAG: aminotransferase class V-fold PLP-dependent enzyme [Rhodospirillales bacterium]
MNDAAKPAPIPPLGAAIRGEFLLDPDFLSVNHGSFGATPRAVLAAAEEWRRRLEAQPTRFMREELPRALRHAAATLGRFVGARGEDIAFVDNATTGCNAVLRSVEFRPGDEILGLDHGYGAVRNAARHVAARAGAALVEAKIPFPRPDAKGVVAAVAAMLNKRTRLAVFDHITSPSALVLPIAELIQLCRDAGVPVLVDGAHGPGHVTLDLEALSADWYTGNGHKWLSTPKGCAFLWARVDRQRDLRPVTISHGYGKGFAAEFDWTGTRGPGAYLAVEAAIAFHERLGGAGLRTRNAALAREAAGLIADALGTEPGADENMHAAMWTVRLPIPGPANPERATALRDRLVREFRTDAPLHPLAGAIWMRISAQAYNEIGDYARLAEIAAALCRSERERN